MKVLHQIIDYLRSRGLLTQEQLVELASQGILRWEQVYEPPEPAAEEDVRAIGAFEDEIAEPGERAAGRGRGRGGKARRPPGISTKELCSRLASRFEEWNARLAGLAQLGDGPWDDAAVKVRNHAPGALAEHLAGALKEQSPSLKELWEALDLDVFGEALSSAEAYGQTGHAFRVLLAARGPAGLGRYGALLHEPEVATAVNLVQAQRRIAGALGDLLHEHPDLIGGAVRRDGPSEAYWAFVLTYGARRGSPGKRPWPAADEGPPLRGAPSEGDWDRLWGHAVAMDGVAVTPFLVERTRLVTDRPQVFDQVLTELIGSLENKPREMLYRYFARKKSLAEAAEAAGMTETEARRVHQTFRQDLRQALAGHPATRVFLQPAAVRAWDAFLTDCLFCVWDKEKDYLFNSSRMKEYPALFQAHFGPAFDLLCPRSWS